MTPPRLPHVKYVRSRGKLYAYFNTGQKDNGKAVYARLPPPTSADFYQRYGQLKANREKREKAAYTVSRLARDYQNSRDFAEKAQATRALYGVQLRKVDSLFGAAPVDELTPRDVRLVLDGEGWGAGTQNAFKATLSALYAWGRERGLAHVEPCKDIKRMKGGEHAPWPDDILEAALVCEGRVRLAVHLLYFTGQRIGDVVQMRWGDLGRDDVRVRQSKTGKVLHIPLARELAAELAQTPRTGLTILTGDDGRPCPVWALRGEMKAFTRALGVETVPHGLRKNAVNALLEAGCTIAEVAAITGQTYSVVEHYAAKVNTRKLGKAAIVKFDAQRRKG
jgi:integrase